MISRRLLFIVAGTCLLVACNQPAQNEYVAEEEMARYRQELVTAFALVNRKDHQAASDAFAEVIANPLFAQLARSEQRMALSRASDESTSLGDFEQARDWIVQLTAIDPGVSFEWYWLSAVELHLGNLDTAADHLIRFASDHPDMLDQIDLVHAVSLVQAMDASSAKRLELLQTLFDSEWAPKRPGESGLWHAMAVAQIERGDTAGAATTLARITHPYELVKIRSDRRFDALIDPESDELDVERAAGHLVKQVQSWFDENPDSNELAGDLLTAMLIAAQNDEVIAMTDSPSGRLSSSPNPDGSNQGWIGNARAMALARAGRVDEGLEALRQAGKFGEFGAKNVSQTLNFATFACQLGHHEEADAAVSDIGEMSGFGRMVLNYIRVCIAMRTENTKMLSEALAYLRKNRADGAVVYMNSLLQADRLDEAAEVMIELLQSPVERADALFWAQDFSDSSCSLHTIQIEANRQNLLSRGDVKRALERVGRWQRYPIQRI